MKIKLMLVPQAAYGSEGVANFNVMMMMIIIIIIIIIIMSNYDYDDDDHDVCKCGATSGLGRTCLNVVYIMRFADIQRYLPSMEPKWTNNAGHAEYQSRIIKSYPRNMVVELRMPIQQ